MSAGYGGTMPARDSSDDEIRFVADAPPVPALTVAPCKTCPYRRDVPSGVWEASEYRKLPAYDHPVTMDQPWSAFFCHKQTGDLCAGWVGCHDMDNSLALRLALASGRIDATTFRAAVDYVSPVPLFASGAEACEHGLSDVERPSERAVKAIDALLRRKARRSRRP